MKLRTAFADTAPGSLADTRAPSRSAPVEIDLARLADNGYLVPALDQSMLAEEFRYLKRVLLANVVGAGESTTPRGPLIAVTSALPGEGKTYCAINLAMSLAMEIDTSVLLIDADVLRPSVMSRLGLRAERGLLDVLLDGRLDLSEVVLQTNVPKLSLLPAGTLNSRASELLSSAAMQRLLAELAVRYPDRVVIFDAPPLLLATGATTLATRVGQVVMVVEASRTARSAVAQAYASLESCPVVLSVLNKCVASPDTRRFGYYYTYGEPEAPRGLFARWRHRWQRRR